MKQRVKRIMNGALHFWRMWYVKYLIVCILGVLIVGFLDENSVLAHFNNKRRISALQEEIAHYEAIHQNNQQQLKELKENPKAMEKIARERYFMKCQDEDIFVLSDDAPQTVQNLNPSNEAAK